MLAGAVSGLQFLEIVLAPGARTPLVVPNAGQVGAFLSGKLSAPMSIVMMCCCAYLAIRFCIHRVRHGIDYRGRYVVLARSACSLT